MNQSEIATPPFRATTVKDSCGFVSGYAIAPWPRGSDSNCINSSSQHGLGMYPLRCLVSHHCVEERQQRMHGGDHSDLLGFAPDNQARVEGPDGGDPGHV